MGGLDGGQGQGGREEREPGGSEGKLGLGSKAAAFKYGGKAGVGLVIIMSIIRITFLSFSNSF